MRKIIVEFSESQFERIRQVASESEKTIPQVVQNAVNTILFEWHMINTDKPCSKKKENNP